MQLNRNSIIEAALDILGQFGLADLTMRRLAKSLDVAPGALYWHFPNKQALLGGIAAHLLAAVAAPERRGDRPDPGGAYSYCSSIFDALTSTRDGAEITLAAVASGTLERDLSAELAMLLGDSAATDGDPGLPPQHAARVLLRYVFGAAMDIQSRESVRLSLPAAVPATPATASDSAPAADPAASKSIYEFRNGLRAVLRGLTGLTG